MTPPCLAFLGGCEWPWIAELLKRKSLKSPAVVPARHGQLDPASRL
jgi:hypothetical protein